MTEQVPVHGIVTGGGLSAEGTPWQPSHPRFLFAVEAPSPVLRGKYRAGLRRLRHPRRLHCGEESATRAEHAAWTVFLRQVQDRPWVVYTKPPWGGPEQVLKSLSHYTPRVASAKSRLVFVGAGMVRFCYKDYSAGGAPKIMALRAAEFLRRVLLPVVPPGVGRIRHCGLLANRTRQDKLARCRHPLAVAAMAATSLLPPKTRETPTVGAETASSARWPACGGGPLRVIATVAPRRGIPP